MTAITCAVMIIAVAEIPLQNVLSGRTQAAAGDGHMILFWDGASVPSGWSCVSCTAGDDFYQRFIRGSSTYGATGGSATHTHTATATIDPTTDTMPARSRNAGVIELHNNDHTHTATPTFGAASNLPVYRQLQVIRHDNVGDPAVIPAGAIAIFDTAVPTGWTRYAVQDNQYIYGENTVGATGGSNTHTHAITGTTSTPTGGERRRNTAGTQVDVAEASHVHDISGTSASASNEPDYVEVILGKADADSAVVDAMYAMWDDTPTTQWEIKSLAGGAFDSKFLKPSVNYGVTGGADNHNHADISYATGTPTAVTTSRTPGTANASDDQHTHNVTISNVSTDAHLPPYVEVIIAKKTTPSMLEQSAYRWFSNTDSTDVGGPLAVQDSLANAPPQGTAFRLRFLLHSYGSDYTLNGESLKLQYAPRIGSCDIGFIDEVYSDVLVGSGDIQYFDNTSVSDGDSLTANANDPVNGANTIRPQTYNEASLFNNAVSAVASGEDGLWDVSLVDVSAVPSTTYCFRVVRSNSTLLDLYTSIPEITTNDGLGHLIMFWDGGAIPADWSCVSCDSTQPFYERFIYGSDTYGAVGGSSTSTTTASATVGAQSALSGRSSAGTGFIRAHDHTLTPIIGDAANLPNYRELQVIRYDFGGAPAALPAGVIGMFDAAPAAGWTQYTAQNGAYVRGASSSGATGGSNTHTHTITGTTSIGSGVNRAQNPNNTQATSATQTHTHSINGNTDNQSNEPPYIETILAKLDTDASPPLNLIAAWDGSLPSATWTSVSGSGGAFNQRFVKPAATYGTTGGALTHTHGTVVITSSPPSATATTRSGGTNLSSATHTHDVTVDSFAAESNLPPYREAIIAKLTGLNAAPDNPSALDQVKIVDSTSIVVGGYATDGQVRFNAQATDTDNPDDLQLCVEVQEVGTAFTDVATQCGSLVSYTGTAVDVTVTIAGLADGSDYHWQAVIRDGAGATSAWVSFGGNLESEIDFTIDASNPTGTVFDGVTTGVDVEYNSGSLSELSANWNITDGGSGVASYDYSVGTLPGITDVLSWSAVALSTAETATSLLLETSVVYYVNVRATDNAGNVAIISSDGQFVAPTISFTTSTNASGIEFDNLNSANSFTDTRTTTLTTSTNASGGYAIRAYTTGLLENSLLTTIGNFNGGTYLAPDAWQPGDIGYGYTSSDTLVEGVNIFQPAVCAGGGTGPCFAPFTQSAPGDVIADNDLTTPGTAITNDQYTITHRVTVDPGQEPGRYQTVLIFNASAQY